MKKKIWNLRTEPSPDDIIHLLNNEVIDIDEARQMLFRDEEVPEETSGRSKESLKNEIKYLRHVISNLGGKRLIRNAMLETNKEMGKKEYGNWTRKYMMWEDHIYEILPVRMKTKDLDKRVKCNKLDKELDEKVKDFTDIDTFN